MVHEAANTILRDTPKENHEETLMADRLLKLRPIGLKLNNELDLVHSIERCLNHSTNHENRISNDSHEQVDGQYVHHQIPEIEKLKASNFTATLLKIGYWKRVSRNEGDLVAKCYFAKKKLVWEFLEQRLKSKIEIQWSTILAIRADIQDNMPGILEIELSKPPTFFHENDPQPRKHTIWRLTNDFTNGQASMCRLHSLVFPPGSLDKQYYKLLQCDRRLFEISKKPFPSQESPIFESSTYGYSGFGLGYNGPGIYSTIPRIPRQNFVQNQLHYHPFVMEPTPSFYEPPSPIPVQGIESTMSTVATLDRNVPFGQSYNLVPCDQAVGNSQLELIGEMQGELLSDGSQIGMYDNNYHLTSAASLNAFVNLAKEQIGNNTSESDQTLYGAQDDFSLLEYASALGMVPNNVPTQVSPEDAMVHDGQLPWTDSTTDPSSEEGYDHHGNNFNDMNCTS